MTKKELIESIPDLKFKELVQSSTSKKELCKKLNVPYGGQITNIIKTRMFALSISFRKRSKYKFVTKTCPVCKTKFETLSGSTDERTTCSYSCSNTYFRSGPNNGMYKNHSNGPSHYRTKCFHYHGKQCIICSESRIVEVHHLDGNHTNNSKTNLIPLCPNHHQLAHTKTYGKVIADQIIIALSIS